MKIEVNDEVSVQIVIQALKWDYKEHLKMQDREMLAALEVLLRYYMVQQDAEEWIEKQVAKWIKQKNE